MIPTRQDDETLLRALTLMRSGRGLRATARSVGRDPSSLRRAMIAVVEDDIRYDSVSFIALQTYYPTLITLKG